MAIALEFIDFVVPIETIRQKYPGGWAQCLAEHEPLIGGRVGYDDHLFRDGAMSPQDIQLIVERWEALGFETMRRIDDQLHWQDCCEIESMLGGATLPCDWISVNREERYAWLTGTDPGEVVFR